MFALPCFFRKNGVLTLLHMTMFGSSLELEWQKLLKETHTNCALIVAYPIGYLYTTTFGIPFLRRGELIPTYWPLAY